MKTPTMCYQYSCCCWRRRQLQLLYAADEVRYINCMWSICVHSMAGRVAASLLPLHAHWTTTVVKLQCLLRLRYHMVLLLLGAMEFALAQLSSDQMKPEEMRPYQTRRQD